MAKFTIGNLYCTKGINEECKNNKRFFKEILEAFEKYQNKDWGDTCEEDCELNNEAIINGDRILALYKTSVNNVFIITEWDRTATTILFAHEY